MLFVRLALVVVTACRAWELARARCFGLELVDRLAARLAAIKEGALRSTAMVLLLLLLLLLWLVLLVLLPGGLRSCASLAVACGCGDGCWASGWLAPPRAGPGPNNAAWPGLWSRILVLPPVVWWLRREPFLVRDWGRDRLRSREADEVASRPSLGWLGLGVAFGPGDGRDEGPVLWKASEAPLRAVWNVASFWAGEEDLGWCRLEVLGVTGRSMELQGGGRGRGMV
jgi:hypothetical protein